MFDKFREECGVFGIYGHTEAAKLDLPRPLRAPASRPGERRHCHRRRRDIRAVREMGYVNDIFDEADARELPGHVAIGHTRYSTAGESKLRTRSRSSSTACTARSASATTATSSTPTRFASGSCAQGSIFQTNSDTEVVVHLYARSQAGDVRGRARRVGGAAAGRVLVRADHQGPPDRRARSARLPPARARHGWAMRGWSARKPARSI